MTGSLFAYTSSPGSGASAAEPGLAGTTGLNSGFRKCCRNQDFSDRSSSLLGANSEAWSSGIGEPTRASTTGRDIARTCLIAEELNHGEDCADLKWKPSSHSF